MACTQLSSLPGHISPAFPQSRPGSTRFPSSRRLSLDRLLPDAECGQTCRAIRIDRINKKKDEDAIQVEEDLEVCPAECVREIKTEKELDVVLQFGAKHNTLIVVDFFRTACGSCKYIEQGFIKLCRAEGDQQLPVMFFKHNVMDDTEEMSDIADRLRIKAVPLFHFYKGGQLVESFSTRDKSRILEAITKHIDSPIDSILP